MIVLKTSSFSRVLLSTISTSYIAYQRVFVWFTEKNYCSCSKKFSTHKKSLNSQKNSSLARKFQLKRKIHPSIKNTGEVIKVKNNSGTFNHFCLSCLSGKQAWMFFTGWLNRFEVISGIICWQRWFFQVRNFWSICKALS